MVRWSSISLIAISVLHLLVFAADALHALPGWLRLDLWTLQHWQVLEAQPYDIALSGAAFWSSVGSFAIPVILLGSLILRLDGKGEPIPAFVGWGLVAWTLVSSLLMAPSGFPVAFLIALALAVGIERRHSRIEVKS